jgi:hypothetical protein
MFTKEDILCSDKFLALESNTVAYMKQDIFYSRTNTINWRGCTHGLRAAPTWISGHSDYSITPSLYEKYRSSTERWYTVNKECRAPTLHSIPLGITNDCADSPVHRIFGNLDVMLEVMQQPRLINNLVYMNFVIGTYQRERQPVFDLFREKPWVTREESVISMEGRRQFLQSIRNHKFVLCPRGNGVDTHRLWETLYMGSIPIVVRHVAMEDFYDLPVCWIDDWTQVTESFLEDEYARITAASWNLDKLKFGYWRDQITKSA